MTFGERLKQLRWQVGLSQPQLAAASGVPVGTLRDYEQGRRSTEPGFRAVVQLAAALGVSCEAFADCIDVKPKQGKSRKGKAR